MMQRKKPIFLIVGSSSFVGSQIVNDFKEKNIEYYETTRRSAEVSRRKIFLDLNNLSEFEVPTQITNVIVLAGVTNYEQCAKDETSFHVNVQQLPRLCKILLLAKCFVTFVSSNSVFGGSIPYPKENDRHSPSIEYAKQKSQAEAAIIHAAFNANASNLLNIVRLTKVMSMNTPPVPAWLEAWGQRQVIDAFSDFIFCPISRRIAAESIAKLCDSCVSGVFHVSGSRDVTYYEFAKELSSRLGVSDHYVASSMASDKKVKLIYQPMHSGLDMTWTTKTTGLTPQSLIDVVTDIIAEIHHGPGEKF